MGKKPKDPFDIPDIPDIPGLEDDEPASSGPSSSRRARRASAGRGAAGAGSSGDAKGRKSRRGLFFLLGLVVGVAGALTLPPLAADYLGPDLPAFLGGGGDEVAGPVLGKRRDDGRLLLTVDAAQGAMLATFTERVPQIDLLVSEGDTIRLRVSHYQPFVTDPRFLGIRKGGEAGDPSPAAGDPSPAAGDTTGPAPPPDTAG